jgi:regulator of replication initiation timing
MKSVLALITISAILAVSLGANAYFYDQQNRLAISNSDLQNQAADLQNQVANYTEQISSLQNGNANLTMRVANVSNQVEDLSNQTLNLQAENSNLQSKKAQFQTQLNQSNQEVLTNAPKLVTRLGASDMQYDYPGSDIRLYISGEVCNAGTAVARNCRLHVTLYQGSTVAKDTYIELGTLYPGAFREVSKDIYYTGVALTNWTIIPEYT